MLVEQLDDLQSHQVASHDEKDLSGGSCVQELYYR